MEDEVDFVPQVFFRIFALVGGVFFLITIVVALVQSFTNAYFLFIENLVANLNRLGLIFEFIGLLSLLPDMMERKRMANWERRLHSIVLPRSNLADVSRFLFHEFSISNTSDTRGLIGITSQISRLLALIGLTAATFVLMKGAFVIDDISVVFLCLLLLGYIWLIFELLNTKLQIDRYNTTKRSLRLYRIIVFWLCGAITLFIPVLLIGMAVISLLNWIAKNPLSKIIATITFPFILLGTLCQLIASFL